MKINLPNFKLLRINRILKYKIWKKSYNKIKQKNSNKKSKYKIIIYNKKSKKSN